MFHYLRICATTKHVPVGHTEFHKIWTTIRATLKEKNSELTNIQKRIWHSMHGLWSVRMVQNHHTTSICFLRQFNQNVLLNP